MHPITQAFDYLKYLLTAKTKYYIHSPFVYELCEQVIYDHRHYYYFDDIEKLRSQLLGNHTSLTITDFGAGSRQGKQARSIAQLAKQVAVPPQVGRLLFRLVDYFQPQTIVELGTNLGISALYLANANRRSQLHTIEGSRVLLDYAQLMFNAFEQPNIHTHCGLFDEVLPQLLPTLAPLDMVLIDGNHQLQPTLRYFEWCLAHSHNNTVLIIDDIHWSGEMQEAWQQIKAHPQVSVTIDLYRLGLVFLRSEQKKENFTLYFF